MKEKNIVLSSIDEISQMERLYSEKNKRENINIKNRIGDHEKVIFCYYEIIEAQNTWGFGTHPELAPYILTDLKFIYVINFRINQRVVEIPLDKIGDVTVKQGMAFSQNYQLWIRSGEDILDGVNVDVLRKLADMILKAKANFHNRLLNPTAIEAKSSNQDSISEQLEKLADLYKSGILTDDEYKRAKERVLAKN